MAQENLNRNPQLKNLIELRKSREISPSSPRFSPLPEGGGENYEMLLGNFGETERFHFCMCNPPFFGKLEESKLNPRTDLGGTVPEMVYRGGEEAFVGRIIDDSLALRERVQ